MTISSANARRLRLLFIIDRLETLHPEKDTTFVLMLESLSREHHVATCELHDMFVAGGSPKANAESTRVERSAPYFYRLGRCITDLAHYDAIFMRKDPPVDPAYIHSTQILSLLPDDGPLLLNNPRALRDANEKLYPLHFPALIPNTLVTSSIPQLKQFLDELGGEMIIKPLDGAGGRGIFYVHRDDRNLNSLLETSTNEQTQQIIAQQYIPEVSQGDKRILLLDGEPIGAVLRVPQGGDTRSNIHVGGACERTTLSETDIRIVRNLGPSLRENGLIFVGIDVIGPYLTEINVTSPTGIQEVDMLDGTNISAQVIDFVEIAAAERRSLLPA